MRNVPALALLLPATFGALFCVGLVFIMSRANSRSAPLWYYAYMGVFGSILPTSATITVDDIINTTSNETLTSIWIRVVAVGLVSFFLGGIASRKLAAHRVHQATNTSEHLTNDPIA